MGAVEIILLSAAAVSIAAAAIYSVFRLREKATFGIMNDMLDSAINNAYQEASYDETRLSALENKLNRFLTMSKFSELNISEERNRIKELVSDISHQTKTPLSNILLYAQLLNEQQGLPEHIRPLTAEIAAQSEKLSFLIQALIKASRLETGIIRVSPGTSNVKELIVNSVNIIKEKADRKSISLTLSCGEDLRARFDMKWTEEAVANILDNAVKYTSPGGAVTVSATAYELFIRIDIADTGIGIAEEEINLIFKRFYRSPAVSRYEGVGIGLYLARQVLAAQGGYIKVKSEPGKGSAFSLFLPKGKDGPEAFKTDRFPKEP